MDGMLFLDAAALRREPDHLLVLLKDHVGSERAGTRLLLQMLDAAQRGRLSHCVIVPDPASAGEPDGGWTIRIVYQDEHPELR